MFGWGVMMIYSRRLESCTDLCSSMSIPMLFATDQSDLRTFDIQANGDVNRLSIKESLCDAFIFDPPLHIKMTIFDSYLTTDSITLSIWSSSLFKDAISNDHTRAMQADTSLFCTDHLCHIRHRILHDSYTQASLASIFYDDEFDIPRRGLSQWDQVSSDSIQAITIFTDTFTG